MKQTSLLSLLGLLLVPTLVLAQPAKVKVTNDIPYREAGPDMAKVPDYWKLDIAIPEGEGPFPAIVVIHGGGWRAGSRKGGMTKLMKLFAEKGFVSSSISYRLSQVAKFPAQIEDCKAAVRFLRANAKKFKIDPKKIGCVGFSAGGHLVCLLGAADKDADLEGDGGNLEQSSRVQAVVSFFGPTDFMTKRWDKKVEDYFFVPFLGGTYEKAKDQYIKASPLKYVSKDDPPYLFFHGDKDKLVGLHHSIDMDKALRKVGIDSELVVMKGAAHGWGGDRMVKTLNQTVDFFVEKLKK